VLVVGGLDQLVDQRGGGDAVDLDSIRGDLAGVVQQALDLAHVSVWISPCG
jgi:hypothetical protein